MSKLDITGDINLNPINRILSIPIKQLDRANELIQELRNTDKPYILEVKPKPSIRSKSANDYCWVLCTEISKVLSKEYPTTKEDVYRRFIREGNCYVPIPIRDEKVEWYKQIWSTKGIGWFAEEAYKSHTLEGHTTMHCYYGSSQYDSKEMSRLIDFIVEEAKELGIETKPAAELAALKEQWDK